MVYWSFLRWGYPVMDDLYRKIHLQMDDKWECDGEWEISENPKKITKRGQLWKKMIIAGWRLLEHVWIFSIQLGRIIPSDFHMFQRG